MKLDIGCGKNCREGYEGIDKQNYGQKFVGDALWIIETEFRRETIDGIYTSHFLEHCEQDYIINLLKNCHRILVKDGILWIIVPHKEHDRAYILWHKTFFTEWTFRDLEGYKDWEIIELVTNSRMDIHCKLKKI